jgi:hypothetical protein
LIQFQVDFLQTTLALREKISNAGQPKRRWHQPASDNLEAAEERREKLETYMRANIAIHNA